MEKEKQIRIKMMASYKGHNISANGGVSLTLSCRYSELKHSINVIQLMSNNIEVRVKIHGERPKSLGSFMLKQFIVDGDGESKIKLSGLTDYIEIENLNSLPLANEEINEFQVMLVANIELE